MTLKLKIIYTLGIIPGSAIIHLIGYYLDWSSYKILILQIPALCVQITAVCIGIYLTRKRIKELDRQRADLFKEWRKFTN